MVGFSIILGLLGLIFGSFANAYSFRYISGGSVWSGRSRCPHCGHELGATELVPLFSFFWQRGRCKHCKKPISWQYPLVEASTGLLFISAGLYTGPLIVSAAYLVPLVIYLYLAVVAVIVAVVDFREQIIPDRVILPAMVVVAFLHLALVFFGDTPFADCWLFLAAAFGSAGTLWLVAEIASRIVGKEAMGAGDIKLTFLIGLLLGWPGVLVALLISFWAGALVGIFLLSFGRRRMADRIPFGPYLIMGAAAALVWGPDLTRLFAGL